jgi:alkylated DNA repair protein alkB family protein 8
MDIEYIYNQITESFSRTRYKKWSCVNNFLKQVKENDKIIELGCGNGKNIIEYSNQSFGVDLSKNLVDVCKRRGLNVVHGDILNA